jgi:hypothetical protein
LPWGINRTGSSDKQAMAGPFGSRLRAVIANMEQTLKESAELLVTAEAVAAGDNAFESASEDLTIHLDVIQVEREEARKALADWEDLLTCMSAEELPAATAAFEQFLAANRVDIICRQADGQLRILRQRAAAMKSAQAEAK